MPSGLEEKLQPGYFLLNTMKDGDVLDALHMQLGKLSKIAENVWECLVNLL
ncbi:MAG: hypothetical protein PHP23_15960 [Desulfobacterales bacterium]|nr:hypothetical protein [Desulfobacterales bacterium]